MKTKCYTYIGLWGAYTETQYVPDV